MIQAKDIKIDKSISTKSLLSAEKKVINGDTAFIVIRGRFSVNVAFEFVKYGKRWKCVGMGRPDHSFVPIQIRETKIGAA